MHNIYINRTQKKTESNEIVEACENARHIYCDHYFFYKWYFLSRMYVEFLHHIRKQLNVLTIDILYDSKWEV